jgi:tetratricopeptide (TPR) repeat protein
VFSDDAAVGFRREVARIEALTKDRKARLDRSRRHFWAVMLTIACVAGLVLLAPLAGVPVPSVLLFLAALALFMTPGLVLASFFLRNTLISAAYLPVAFALSTAAFGFPGIPALLLHWPIETYLLICGGVLLLSLGLAVLAAFLRPSPEPLGNAPGSRSSGLLWIFFLALGSLLALAAVLMEHPPSADTWPYLAYIADFSERDRLALYGPFSGPESAVFNRMFLNGWLLEQAALVKVTGIAPVELVLDYLAPALVILALLAFYSLALTLFEDRSAALLAGVLYALFFLVHLTSVHNTMGGEFLARITEDKFVARFVHLPVALSMAVLFVRERRWRYLALFATVFWATGVVHPLLMAIVAICLTGFGLLHLALNLKKRGAWTTVGAIAAVPSLTILPPALYLIATGNALLNKFEAGAPLTAPRIEDAQALGRLMVLGEDSYIMDPALMLDPTIAAAYVLGVPFLVWQIRKPAAQLLLGTMLLVPALVYIPAIATFISRFVGPWSLWRLAWPIPLASVLVLAWISWFVLELVRRRLQGMGGRAARLAPVLPLALVLALTTGAAALNLEGLRAADESGKIGQEDDTCRDPAFSFLGEVIDDQAVVLTDDSIGGCVGAHASEAVILAYRALEGDAGQAPASLLLQALNNFFGASTLDKKSVQSIQSFGTKYVLLPVGSPLNEQLEYSPGFTALDTPGSRYQIYEVDWAELAAMPVHAANGSLNEGIFDTAVGSYSDVVATAGSGEAFLAYIGLGQAYAKQGLHTEAAAAYEQAIALKPEEAHPYELLAQSYAADGNLRQAAAAYEEAIALKPDDVRLRQRFAALLSRIDQEEALEQYRTIVEIYPRVPEYRAGLGAALLEAGRKKEGEEQLQRAVALDPFSARVRGLVGDAYGNASLLTEAAEQYERARELYSNNQAHALRLGEVYAELSAQEGGEDYAKKAEKTLKDAVELAGPGQERQKAKALLALGKLYEKQGRTEEAADRYREAQEVSPELRSARNALEKLEDGATRGDL